MGSLDIITGPMFSGKCLGKDTPILMYDGSIKKVQDITTSDLLMGNDSTPRRVLNICSGEGKLYKVIPKFGDPYIVNEDHILSLKFLVNGEMLTYNISIHNLEEYEWKKYWQDVRIKPPTKKLGYYTGYRVGVNFPPRSIYKDPYEKAYDVLFNQQRIPNEYKINSENIRLNFLAGLVNFGGTIYPTYLTIKIAEVRHDLICDILFLVRSLSMIANIAKNTLISNYTDIIIEGRRVQKVINRIESSNIRKPYRDIPLEEEELFVPIEIEKLGKGEYYGFTLDKNHLFLLGDFTVTHNTTELLRRLCRDSEVGFKILYINHSDDIRSSESYSTHNPLYKAKLGTGDSISTDKLIDEGMMNEYLNYDIIGIDEAQFFSDLVPAVTMLVETYKKHVIVSGLSSDFKREKFGGILELEPLSDTFTKLSSYCKECARNNKTRVNASFSHRISGGESQKEVGSREKYIPVCRECYQKLN